ncbi:uncharacterized protein FOMMEDRAFT_149982 [Fomitiporia mediterranea MF3/22]|uniref:uncharacterized protein n=1 Tax=Fomitiporia mediterranea (strain MF3/22) TaxID=694068 RepID=UPI0004407AB4|nr:uncharacterized protein FOMMEDRAFT_149982 [Fomitiporia mediterranea MF3/22]EJD07452.1 hypothetical protein FOMMEDRAFT_149982 [Fomitiporia mediterranea MF3/22]
MSVIDLFSLSLFPATEDQIVEGRKRWHKQWSAHLTLEEHLNRFARLDMDEHCRDGKLSTWVIAPRDDPRTLTFKCCSEVFRRKAIVKRPDTDMTEEVIAYAVTAVYTPPEYRGRGYARHMMRLLHWVLALRESLPPFPSNWGDPPPKVPGFNDAQFSVLYSYIGRHFYASAGPDENSEGWLVCNACWTTWDLAHTLTEIRKEGSCERGSEWLDEEGCNRVWQEDAQLMQTFLDLPPEFATKRTVFAFLPTDGVALSHLRRTPCFDAGQPYPTPTKWGVELHSNPATLSSLVFATWEPKFRPSPTTLNITRLRATKETFPKLLQLIFVAAREMGMERVKVWNLPNEFRDDASATGGVTAERNDGLSCFKWYGPESREDLHWVYNEKYCWT